MPGDDDDLIVGHIIVAGLHGIGLRVVEQLHRIGQRIVVIDEGADDRSVRLIREWGIRHIVGNARRKEVLESAGLDTAAALICVEQNELNNFEIALLARELRPRTRVIVRSSNAAVGSALEKVTGRGTVLNAAALAAPAFVKAALQSRDHDVYAGSQYYRVVEVNATREGTLREIYGDLAPISIIPPDGEPRLCPDRDQVIRLGERVALLGTAEELKSEGLLPDGKQRSRRAVGARYQRDHLVNPRSGSIRALWHTITFGADRALKTTVMLVVLLTITATIVIDIGYVNYGPRKMDLVDSIYTTIQTLVTVGYGDFPFGDQPTHLRIFDIALMLIGTALIAVLFAQLTDLLVSRRIAASFGSQRAATLRDHVIVVGLGSVGTSVAADLLSEGRQVAVIEPEPEARFLSRARAMNVPVVVGATTDPDTFAAANLSAASAVAIVTSDDFANIETGLAVLDFLGDRRDTVPTVLRLFDRQLSTTVERTFGFKEVRSTAALAAPWFVAAALGLEVFSAFTVANHTMLVGRLTVTPDGGLVGVVRADLDAQIRVIAIRRVDSPDDFENPPRRDVAFAAGDLVYIVGQDEELIHVLMQNHGDIDTDKQL
ncbi:MAG: NAD-binding protein [Candidatus Nanopelagicales bacterium]